MDLTEKRVFYNIDDVQIGHKHNPKKV